MATVQKFLPYDVSSDANFDQWGSGIHDAILNTFGWQQTADTGQVDWSTNPARPAAGSYLYEIWKPTDALQTGGSQFFVKFEYGNVTGPKLSLRIQIGTGTNGSGSLTGYTTMLVTLPVTAQNNLGAVGYECNFSGDPGRWGMMLWRNAGTNYPVMIAIERLLNSDGTPSADGVYLFCARISSLSAAFSQVLAFPAGPAQDYGEVGSVNAGRTSTGTEDALTTSAFNNKVAVLPIFPIAGQVLNPVTVIAAMRSGDVADGALVSTTLYGASRVYMAGKTSPLNCAAEGGRTGSVILMRYD
jgi:hypothetical protein